MNENAEDRPTDILLARTLRLLAGNEIRTIQVSYNKFSFEITYDLRKLTCFAYYNRTHTDPTHYMCEYILASVTGWTLFGSDGVTQLPLDYEGLLRVGFEVVGAIGKALASDYKLIADTTEQAFS
jgi:hypothetical protein